MGWALLAAMLPGTLLADEFKIERLSTRLADKVFLMDANIEYEFSEEALEALENGVPLTLEVHIQVRRDGAWVWESDLLDMRQRYQIRYHALASLYQVTDLQSNQQQSFVTRKAALSALGQIQGLTVISRDRLEPDEQYLLSLKTSLDIESLPLPLRPMAYLTPGWNLSSKRRSWHLRP